MKTRTMIGIGALACIACCFGPILAALGAVAALGVASTVLIGGAGLVIVAAAIAAAVILVRRRARSTACENSTGDVDVPVSVELTPTRR
jgi:hypothetical protein